MMYLKPVKKKKCKECKKYYEDEKLDGRSKFYTTKYCSKTCSALSLKRQQAEKSKRQSDKNRNKFPKLSGKITRECKKCGNEYQVYASQFRFRGSNYCSKKCKNESTMKGKTLSTLKKDLWTIFSKYTRVRDAIRTTGGSTYVHCITCNDLKKVIETDAGHFFSRTHSSILYDEKNVHAQCKKCNMPPNSGEQYKYSLKIIELYGKDVLEELERKRYELKKFTKEELSSEILRYKALLSELIDKHGSPWR